MKKICCMVYVLLIALVMSGATVYADLNEKEYYPGTPVITYESVTGNENVEIYNVDGNSRYRYWYDNSGTNTLNKDYNDYTSMLEKNKWVNCGFDQAKDIVTYSRNGWVIQIHRGSDNTSVSIAIFKDHDGKYEVIDNSVITVYINGESVYFDVEPQLINGRTMVPMRAIFEALDCEVEWDNDNQQITATKKEDAVVTTIVMQIDKNSMMVDEEEKILDVAPTLVDGRTLVPVRAISEALGVNVEWHNPIQAVDIYDEKANTTVLYNENDDTVNSPSYLVKKYQHAGYSKNKGDFYTTMYAMDGRTISVKKSEVEAYKKVGWYANRSEVIQTLYSPNGSSKEVYKSEVQAYLNDGWYADRSEVIQTLYSPNGSSKEVYKSEVQAYLNDGWYEYPVDVVYDKNGKSTIVKSEDVDAWLSKGYTTIWISECFACNGYGYCRVCKGTGKTYGNTRCFGCEGLGMCTTCYGTGNIFWN